MSSSTSVSTTEVYGFAIERTAKFIKRCFQQVLKKTGEEITVDQWVIMYELYKCDGLSQFEIGERTYKQAPAITRILDFLSSRNLITREAVPDDRRKFQIHLTQQGKQKVEKLLPMALEFRRKGWEGLTDEDMHHLLRILNRIDQNFRKQ
ncbi:MAG: MarR family transcriptional regulator [Bacteroidota bacterium]